MAEVYYNDNDPYVAQRLRNLIEAGLIPKGHVDERPIQEVKAKDVSGFGQCHWFAGIAGWAYALQLAGWGADEPVWTGSCPCQPLSCAGKRQGEMDDRHLWPVWYELIAECRPDIIFGEQTASGDGPEWLDGISLDLEELGYAVGPGDLPAACVGAPTIRQRLWWVADAKGKYIARTPESSNGSEQVRRTGQDEGASLGRGSGLGGLDDAMRARHRRTNDEVRSGGESAGVSGAHERMGNANGEGPQGRSERSEQHTDQRTPRKASTRMPWDHHDLCWRRKASGGGEWCRIESGTFPLAPRVPGDVEQIGTYGRSIVPQVAAEFILAYMEARE